MGKETIDLNTRNNTTEWLETLDKKDQHRYEWPLFNTHKMPVSTCGRFAYIFSSSDCLKVIDNYNGIKIELKFTRPYGKTFTHKFDPSLNKKAHFYPTNTFYDGVIFWTEELDDESCSFYVAKVQLNFEYQVFKQSENAVKLKTLGTHWISPFVPGQSIILINERGNSTRNSYQYEMQQFDLITLKFYGPKVMDRRNEMIVVKYFPTFFENCFYDFEHTMESFYAHLESRAIFNAKLFGTINCYDPKKKNGRQQKIKLQNDLECLGIFERGNDTILKFDEGVWCDKSLYFHATLLPNNHDISAYFHFFGLLNLETLNWTPIHMYGKEITLTPLAMSVSDESQMLLVKSTSLLYFKHDSQSLIHPPLYNRFINIGGHEHCSSTRIPMRRPDPLQLIMLQSMNKTYPHWRNTETGKALVDCHKPLTNTHQPPNSNPFLFTLGGIPVCYECVANDSSLTKSQKWKHKLVMFFKRTWIWWFFLAIYSFWFFNDVVPFFSRISGMNDEMYQKRVKYFECEEHDSEWLMCRISRWTGISEFVLIGFSLTCRPLILYLILSTSVVIFQYTCNNSFTFNRVMRFFFN